MKPLSKRQEKIEGIDIEKTEGIDIEKINGK
jgi:hypothetical protein